MMFIYIYSFIIHVITSIYTIIILLTHLWVRSINNFCDDDVVSQT